MIEVNDLHKKFGKVKVLNGIHLEYHPGKIYGLVGENGAGKTTLFNCMTGIYNYTGSITKSKTLKAGYLSASNFFYSQITGSWIQNELTFDNDKLADIIINLNKWYGVDIECPSEFAEKVFMSFSVRNGENLDEILKAMTLVAPIRYYWENGILHILPRK